MRSNIIVILLIGLVAFMAGCDSSSPPHLKMINVGESEYLYVKSDQKVKGASVLCAGYSLRSTKNDKVLHTFQHRPKEVRFEDFDGDGVKDLVYIVPDPNVKGVSGLTAGYSMRVALGNGNGTFCQAKVVATFDSIG